MDQVKPSLVQPYLNADVYRAHDNTNARAPSLDSLKIRADGKTLVGCSDLTGRFWNGAVRISDSPADINLENANHIDKSSQSLIELESGANDVCFVNNTNKMVACEDRGCVSVWEYTEEPAWGGLWNLVCSATEHDDAVMAVAPFHDTEAVVTVGADSCVKIWGITEMLAVQTYRAAHGCMIEDVAIQPKSNKIFVTASIDRNISLWDRDLSKRVRILGSLESGARCVCWVDDCRVLIGDEAGDLNVLDVRTSVLTHLKTFYSALHRIVFNERSGLIGVCGDNKTVSVFRLSKSNNLEPVYEDKSHADYVRSLAWDHTNDGVVYSASWDGTIKTHRVDLSDKIVPESSS